MSHAPTSLRRLHWQSDDFAEQWRKVSDRGVDASSDTELIVGKIVAEIRSRGDEALREYTEKFDGRSPTHNSYEIAPARWQAAWERCSPAVQSALTTSADRIRRFHQPQLTQG